MLASEYEWDSINCRCFPLRNRMCFNVFMKQEKALTLWRKGAPSLRVGLVCSFVLEPLVANI